MNNTPFEIMRGYCITNGTLINTGKVGKCDAWFYALKNGEVVLLLDYGKDGVEVLHGMHGNLNQVRDELDKLIGVV